MKANILRDPFGLIERNWEEMRKVFEKYPSLQEVSLFGSRAKGNFRRGSDIDLAITLSFPDAKVVRSIHFDLEENTSIPYFFDIIETSSITSEALKEHLRLCSKIVWKR